MTRRQMVYEHLRYHISPPQHDHLDVAMEALLLFEDERPDEILEISITAGDRNRSSWLSVSQIIDLFHLADFVERITDEHLDSLDEAGEMFDSYWGRFNTLPTGCEA